VICNIKVERVGAEKTSMTPDDKLTDGGKSEGGIGLSRGGWVPGLAGVIQILDKVYEQCEGVDGLSTPFNSFNEENHRFIHQSTTRKPCLDIPDARTLSGRCAKRIVRVGKAKTNFNDRVAH
jgi:hypothetical protein